MIISKDVQKAFDKIQYLIWYKFSKLSIERNIPSIKVVIIILIKAIYDGPIASIILSSQKLKAFSLKLETREGYPFSPYLLNKVLDILARAIRQWENKNNAIWKGN